MAYLKDMTFEEIVEKFMTLSGDSITNLGKYYKKRNNFEMFDIVERARKLTEVERFRKRECKRKYGIFEPGEFSKAKNKFSYDIWTGMLDRVLCPKHLEKRPAYKGVKISEDFMHFQIFAKWHVCQIGFLELDFQLDKDLLSGESKIYSAETCLLLPRQINVALQPSRAKDLPPGVFFRKDNGKFVSQISKFGENVHLGQYDSSEVASFYYLEAKRNYLKELAEMWKKKIDIRAYNALINYEVK